MAKQIWTVGHSTRSEGELLDLLTVNDIETLVDVRSYPASRRYPHFNQDEMARWITEAGIEYRHLPSLGGRRKAQHIDSVTNGAWHNASFRNYADYTMTNEFTEGISELCRIAGASRTAIMCAEALPWRCHRSLISSVLVAGGWEVTHIMCDKNRPHVLGQWGPDPMVDGGRVTYPAPQLSLIT
jgi:uncharacterized protein (DUF488 family)